MIYRRLYSRSRANITEFLGPHRIFTPLQTFTRNASKKPFVWYGEGIKYHGFTYYPRHPDFKDPPYEPAKLFRVQRIKPVKGNPYWEKDILKALKLDGKISDVVIIKNIPEMNSKLWRIKHLVKIEPITFPDGFPKDNRGTYLKENGELAVKNELIASETSLEKAEEFKTDSKRLDGETLRRDSRLKWLSGW